MERLTHPKRDERGNVQCAKQYTCDHEEPCDECEQWPLIAEKVYKYEDTGLSPEEVAELARAKEEERLVVLPCGVGSKVYIICRISKEIAEGKVLGLSILGERTCLITEVGTGNFSAIGRTIFLTREAAEAALQRSAT